MSRRETRRIEDESYRTWDGGYRRYDILKEATIALGVVAALVLRADDPVLVTGPCAEHGEELVAQRPRRLRHDRHHGA